MKISGVSFSDIEEMSIPDEEGAQEYLNFISPPAVTNVLRPGSPINMRTPSPPHGHLSSSRSPKSPRGAGRINRSPLKTPTKSTGGGKIKSYKYGPQIGQEEVDGGQVNGVHLALPAVLSDGNSSMNIDGHREKEQELTVDSFIPKPDSSLNGLTDNHIPKVGTTIPQFYFPNGKPQPGENLEDRLSELTKLFQSFEGEEAGKTQFEEVTKASCT